jgi:hypothetical protein
LSRKKGFQIEKGKKILIFLVYIDKSQDPMGRLNDEEKTLHGSRHKRKHSKGRRKVGQKKRRMMRQRRALRT